MKTSFLIGSLLACVAATSPTFAQGQPQTATLVRVEPTRIVNALRASDIIGSKIANDRNDNIGSVDDLLIQNGGKDIFVVIDVGGFLGMGEQHVVVPYNELKMGATSAGKFDRDKVILPGATKEALQKLPKFEYSHR